MHASIYNGLESLEAGDQPTHKSTREHENRYQSAALIPSETVQQMWGKVPKGRHAPYAMLLLWLLCKQLSNYHRFQSSTLDNVCFSHGQFYVDCSRV